MTPILAWPLFTWPMLADLSIIPRRCTVTVGWIHRGQGVPAITVSVNQG